MINTLKITNALTYDQYRELINRLLKENKTTGNIQNESRTNFTILNNVRMNRLDKTVRLNPELIEAVQSVKEKQNWFILAEAWCGDCAQNIPVLSKIASSSNGKIELKILLRDENPEIMSAYLTNGAKSIPKLIVLNSGPEIKTWGPRPAPAQNLMYEWKNSNGKITWDEFEKKLHQWYNEDKSETLQNEIINLLTHKNEIK